MKNIFMKSKKPILLDHYSVYNQFTPMRYLVYYYPNKYITDLKLIFNKELKANLDTLKIILSKIGFFPLLGTDYFINKEKNAILLVSPFEDTLRCLYIYYTEDYDISYINEVFKEYTAENIIEDSFKFSFITINNNQPNIIRRRTNKKIILDKYNSYNPNCPIDSIIEDISSNESGLIIFHSKPGAGKTSLIKYLSQELQDKEFFFLPNNNFNILTDPSFVEFCLNELQDSILVLEDCERLLLNREINKGYDISNILNITDGIMGDLLNIKIIATLNTADKIDEALLRKGRLIRKVEFKELTKDQVINLGKFLNKTIEEPREMMLCDVYNTSDNGIKAQTREKIGFIH